MWVCGISARRKRNACVGGPAPLQPVCESESPAIRPSCQASVLFFPAIATILIQQIPPGRPTLYLLRGSFAPDPSAPFLYFRTISRQPSPVLLCIWLIGGIRQKPDKEVRDRRLSESRPGALCLTRPSDENPDDLPPHHPVPASCGRKSKKGQLTMTAHNDLVQNLYDDCSPTTTCSPAAPIARDRRPAPPQS